MSKHHYINTVNSYSVEDFTEFLKNNNFSDIVHVVRIKGIDGRKFMNLTEFEINSWKQLVNLQQIKSFKTFRNRLLTSPETFCYIQNVPKNPQKLSENSERLRKLSYNSKFIDALQAAVKNNVVLKPTVAVKPSILFHSKESHISAPPIPPKTYLQEAEDDSDDTNDEPQYVSPDEENNDMEDTKPLLAVTKEQPRRFKLQEYYQKKAPKSNKVPQEPATRPLPALPPLPSVPIATNAKLTSISKEPVRKLSFPRPPAFLPKVEVPPLPSKSSVSPVASRTPSPKLGALRSSHLFIRTPSPTLSVPEQPKFLRPLPPKPIEQEDFYRYTDRKGAEDLLGGELGNGTYLIRPSRNYYVTLSVREDDKIYHIGIEKIANNRFEVVSSGLNLEFGRIHEVVEYFKDNPLTVRNKYNEIVDIYLTRTLPAHIT